MFYHITVVLSTLNTLYGQFLREREVYSENRRNTAIRATWKLASHL